MSINCFKFKTSSAMCQYFKEHPELSAKEMDEIVCQCVGFILLQTWREAKERTVNSIQEYYDVNISCLEEALEANE